MNTQHPSNWIMASEILRKAIEEYQYKQDYSSLGEVIFYLSCYINDHAGGDRRISEKTIRRDIGNSPLKKRCFPIQAWRIRLYAKWLQKESGKDREWVGKWLESTNYPMPGRLLVELFSDISQSNTRAKTNVLPLRTYLWGDFLGRSKEIQQLQEWADRKQTPVAILFGFGGNGKTTIQQKVGEDFIYGDKCVLQWPYDAAIWVSALDYPIGMSTLAGILQCIATTLGLFESQENIGLVSEHVIQAKVKAKFEEQRILVLLDNFEHISHDNQNEILTFFYSLHGTTQLLISTRHRPEQLFKQGANYTNRRAHLAIPVDGLLDQDAKTLLENYIQIRSSEQLQHKLSEEHRSQILRIAQNNPKVILALLGLLESAISASQLVEAIQSRQPEIDDIYNCVIGTAWDTFLTEEARKVLVAKALFAHSVLPKDLATVADLPATAFEEAVKVLKTISFFDINQRQRIQTHPLAQGFALQMLQKTPELRSTLEIRWWKYYCSELLKNLGDISIPLDEDIRNIYAQVEYHVLHHTPFSSEALKTFAKPEGLGNALRHRGRWAEMMLLAKKIIDIAIQQNNARLLGLCALRFIGRVHRVRGELDKAERYLGLVEEHNVQLQDKWLKALIITVKGALRRQQKFTKVATQCYQKALNIFIKLGDFYYIAKLYSSLGGTLIQHLTEALDAPVSDAESVHAQLAVAEEYFEKAVEYWSTKEMKENWSSQMELLKIKIWKGVIYRIQGNFEESRVLFHECLDKLGMLNNARIYRELALLEHIAGQYQCRAEYYETLSLTIFEKLGIPASLINYQCHTSSPFINRMKKDGSWYE